MAVDEALLREIREPVLRIYEWNVPALSIGYFQPFALAGHRPFIRRYTGGGLVDHAHDVTYTIVLPRAHPWMDLSAPESYCTIHRGVQAALAVCGIESELTPSAHAIESESCFQKPVKFDIVLSDKPQSSAAPPSAAPARASYQGSILLPDPSRNAILRRDFAQAFSARMELVMTLGQLHLD